MKVLIVYQYYQGVNSPGHSLMYDLTQYLVGSGHQVTVVSGETGYMKREMPNKPWYRRIVSTKYDGGVKVISTYTYSHLHKSYFGRLLSFISFSLSCPLGLLKAERPDVVLASSPPIIPIFVAWVVCKLRGLPFVFEVRDLWPDSAVQMGLLKNRLLIRVMSWMEKILYTQSNRIVALTEGIRKDICNRGWDCEKVELLTCGVDFQKLYPDREAGDSLRKLHGWTDVSVIMYFGALGDANNISVIIRAARRLIERPDMLFVMVGDGMRREIYEKIARSNNLNNIVVLPPVPKCDARKYINAADLCLVTLQDIPLFKGAIPTKMIDYMACGRPVLCGIRGEAMDIVSKAGAGVFFEPDDDSELARLIIEKLEDPRSLSEMGISGNTYVQEHFSSDKNHKKMEQILRSVRDNYGPLRS